MDAGRLPPRPSAFAGVPQDRGRRTEDREAGKGGGAESEDEVKELLERAEGLGFAGADGWVAKAPLVAGRDESRDVLRALFNRCGKTGWKKLVPLTAPLAWEAFVVMA